MLHAELVETGALIPVSIEAVRGERYVPAEGMPILAQAEREVAAGDPPGGGAPGVAAKRRWGYYVLPILYGDRLVGRIEPRIERKTNELRIAGLW